MRIALVNPPWSFDGSIYFGCREPHLPLEFGYARQVLEAAGHEVLLIDGQLQGLSAGTIRDRIAAFRPDMTVVTTAPSYLFWRCAPPELRVPLETLANLRGIAGITIAIGPHASTTPRAALAKLGVDAVVMGEAEEILVRLADTPRERWAEVPSIAHRRDGATVVQGGPHLGDVARLPALRWSDELVRRHRHHHHRFDTEPCGPGAEMETSRGCPYHCTFCAKENFRDAYRRRPLPVVLDELDRLIGQGIEYVYFIDEFFLPDRKLLEALVGRGVRFGVQTRIDLWKPAMLELLGRAGCVSIEAGVESLDPEGRDRLDKDCRISTDELTERLIFAKRHVAFVQANLIADELDDAAEIERWRDRLRRHGVWANEPVPLFPYPGSPDYRLLWGLPDDRAWERAHAHYLARFAAFSDIQDQRPLPLEELEKGALAAAAR
jgi:B12-binding domain/radical SAM domain protein of rhizo-twelve system